MPKRKITLEEVVEYVKQLPYPDFKDVVFQYALATRTDLEKELDAMISLNLQARLEELGINKVCPKCHSESVMKYGFRERIQVFKCKDCGSKFTLFTGTILEKTKWHWDVWIKVLEMTLNDYSLPAMINVLEDDYDCFGINKKTVWFWRMKLIYALAQMPMPILTGIIQVDETFIRESQKGSRSLVSYIDKNDIRMPRYGRRPSQFGVMGPEFATVVTAIDNYGHCVCKVSGLGKLTKGIFYDLFKPHFDNPSYICSDANSVYEDFCSIFNIAHYERPSSYLSIIDKAGYKTPDYANPVLAQIAEKQNQKILERLYYEDDIDRITNRGHLLYEEFKELKEKHNLNLARVNELHSDIKRFIYADMTNVSTKYLQDYIGYFTFIRNWRINNGHYPNSKKDAEKIFLEILKSKVQLKTEDVKNKTLEMPKPSSRSVAILKQETEKVREIAENPYFKFDEEDGFRSFNKREYLLSISKRKLYDICKECKLTKYRKLAHWSVVSLLLKQSNIDEIIYQQLLKDRHYKIAGEDLEAIRSGQYSR